jgi:activating signal cointegrator complex subunit 2
MSEKDFKAQISPFSPSHTEAMASQTLPPMAPFPSSSWRPPMMPEEWEACLDAWILIAEAHQTLSAPDFLRLSVRDKSVAAFLVSYMFETATSPDIASGGNSLKWMKLRKHCYFVSCRFFNIDQPPESLLSWEYLSDFSKVYGKTSSAKPIETLWKRPHDAVEKSLASLKALLTEDLGSGIKGEPKELERRLKRLNHLLHSSPDTAIYFMNGSDFLDGLVSCYKLMNPPLRKAIISTTYLSIIGLTEGRSPKVSLLTDQLYSLKAAADSHKAGPLNVRESLVAELVTETPILRQIQQRIANTPASLGRVKAVIAFLEAYRKAGGSRPKRLVRRKIGKGKEVASGQNEYGHGTSGEIHVHRMSLITQVQDLFPDLGSGFVMKLLDEYGENVELVISHLLEGSLPAHLENADRTESM